MPKGRKYMEVQNTQQFVCSCGYVSRKYRNQRGVNLAKKLHEKNCDTEPAKPEVVHSVLDVQTCKITAKSK